MSSKATSNKESSNSPNTGTSGTSAAPRAPDIERTGADSDKREAQHGNAIRVEFIVDRARLVSNTFAGLLIGGFLLWKLGTIGQYAGAALIAMGLWNGYKLFGALRFAPGIIAYFLRRSVPWNRSAPLLIIESGGVAHSYPRDWFANEADQRRIISALHQP
jgi:hypothetical protein